MSIAEALRKIDVLKSCKLPDTIGQKLVKSRYLVCVFNANLLVVCPIARIINVSQFLMLQEMHQHKIGEICQEKSCAVEIIDLTKGRY